MLKKPVSPVNTNIDEIIHEENITAGPGEASAGQMELDLLQEWGYLEGVSAYTVAIRHRGIVEVETIMKDPASALPNNSG